MFDQIYKIKSLLNKKIQNQYYLLITLFFLVAILESVGIGLIIPLIQSFGDKTFEDLFFVRKIISTFKLDDLSINNTYFFLVLILFLFLIKNIINLITILFQNYLTKITTTNLSSKLLEIYLNQDYLFHIKNNSSVLLRNTNTNITMFSATLIAICQIITRSFLILCLTGIILYINYQSALFILLICLIVILINNFLIKKKTVLWGKKLFVNTEKSFKNLQQSFSSIKMIKIFNAENYFLNNYTKSWGNTQEAFRITNNYQGFPAILFEIFFIILIATVYFILTKLNFKYLEIISLLSLYFLISIRVIPSIILIYKSIIQINFTKEIVNSLNKDFKLKIRNTKKKNEKNLQFNKSISFKNVSFKYNKRQKNILNNISLTIKKNEFVGIVGTSGSGKSTLINILTGLISADSGKILLDNRKIDISTNLWFEKIGYAPQQTILFDSSIKENIYFGKIHNKKNQKTLRDIIQKTQLKNFINSLPKKENTIVGELGSKLSEGQKQRIGIARALFRDPEILIFDEITSSLDKKTEKKIIEVINKFKGKKTIILISHNKAPLIKCDKILSIDEGNIKSVKLK